VDIILLDIELSNINGYQFAKMLRKGLNQNIPIVALTGYSYEEVSKEAKTHNVEFAAVLTKPVDMKELNKTLHALAS
jgi:CheY-like chemotaxis protein